MRLISQNVLNFHIISTLPCNSKNLLNDKYYDFFLPTPITPLFYYRYDIVLDATDNVATRYLLNDACVLAQKPLVSGSALRFEGQVQMF